MDWNKLLKAFLIVLTGTLGAIFTVLVVTFIVHLEKLYYLIIVGILFFIALMIVIYFALPDEEKEDDKNGN